MSQQTRTICPMDCYAHCGLLATVEEGRVTKIEGDFQHPLNKGLICSKGRFKHLERLYSPNRVTTPLRKTSTGWSPLSWSEANEIIANNLFKIINKYGTTSILHHDNAGSEGILKNLSRRFFNALGGCTRPVGSICWGSGNQAQSYDFGRPQLHSWDDLLNSKLIILWGRDPASTNIQLMPILKQARHRGAKIIVINPIEVASCSLADWHLSPRPGTDGALALAVAHELIKNNQINKHYIDNHVYGYQEYSELIENYTPEKVSAITGTTPEHIRRLASEYGSHAPACILFGYGLQRYTNGGQTVRAINALAAITGNLGIPGGGTCYSGKHWRGLIADITGSELSPQIRHLPWPTLAESMLDATPPVKSIFVTRSNPLTQLPDTKNVYKAFAQSEFTVMVDFFLNDTAELAQLFLPCTTFIEDQDVVYSSWSHYLAYSPRLIEPIGQCRSDYRIFSDLAQYMGLADFPDLSADHWLEKALAPLSPYGIDLAGLKQGPIRNPLAPEVPWQDGCFETPSGKFELYSQLALADGVNPLPDFKEPMESPLSDSSLARDYPLHLITAHHPEYLHSQFWNLSAKGMARQAVYLHPETGAAVGIIENQLVLVATKRGQITCTAIFTDKLRKDTVLMYQGSWATHGNGVNVLTPQYLPDMGLGTPYYDCMCSVYPAE